MHGKSHENIFDNFVIAKVITNSIHAQFQRLSHLRFEKLKSLFPVLGS